MAASRNTHLFAHSKNEGIQFDHSNLANIMIILFVNNKLLIDSCLPKGFPGQLHEALRKCIGILFALRVFVKVAQSVEYATAYYKLFYHWASRVRVPLCTYIYIYIIFFCLILFHYLL